MSSVQSALKIVYMMPAVLKVYLDRTVGLLRRLSAPLRNRYSHPVTQNRIAIFIVCLALLLDNMLYMVIVPIIDDYFRTPDNSTAAHASFKESYVNLNYSGTTVPAWNSSIKNEKLLDKLSEKLGSIKPVKIQDSKDGMMGILFASKAIVQLCANPFTGPFIDRVGYITPLTMGLMVMFLSTVVFACAETYAWLFIARSLQGFGSALANASSFGLIADRFQNEGERSKILGIALAFISFGCLVAPPFGGVLYEFVGRPVPFVILALASLLDASMLLLLEKPAKTENVEEPQPVGTPIYKLLLDPYILVIAGALMVANFPLAFLEPTIAEWMQVTMNAYPWQIGLIWLPPFFPHVLGVYVTVKLSVKYFRYQWLYGAIGMILIGVSNATIPMCKSSGPLVLPLSVLCFGIALIDTALLPTLAFIVDTRHTSVYGSVYAISDISYSVAYALGPVLAGQAVQHMGYLEMNIMIGLANVLFAPLLLTLRRAYDKGADKSQLGHLLFRNPDDAVMEAPVLNGHHTIEDACSISSNKALEEERFSNENVPVRITNRNYRATDVDPREVLVSTTISPRPRPRPTSIPLGMVDNEGDPPKISYTKDIIDLK